MCSKFVYDKELQKVISHEEYLKNQEARKINVPYDSSWLDKPLTRGSWTFKWIDGKYQAVEVTKKEPKNIHFVITDTMDTLEHPCTGEMIDSKSKFERITRENNCVYVGKRERKAFTVEDSLKRTEHLREQAVRENIEKWKSPSARVELQDKLRIYKETGEYPQ